MRLLRILLLKKYYEFLENIKENSFLIIGMILNDLFFLLVWVNFFLVRKNIGGLNFNDVLLLVGSSMLAFGIVGFLFPGLVYIRRRTFEMLEIYLLRPYPVLLQYGIENESFSLIGDIICGLILVFMSKHNILIKFLVLLISCIVFFSFFLFVHSLIIFIKTSSPETFYLLTNLFLSTTIWPSYLIENYFLKFIFLFILPGLLACYFPISVFVKNKGSFVVLFLGTVFWLCFSLFFWKIAIERIKK